MLGLGLISALLIKHMVADFVLQTPWMIVNKGQYGHAGGLAHAGIHSGLTLLVIIWVCAPLVAVTILVAEFIVHYHLDWGKEKVNQSFATTPENGLYWRTFGIDQLAHQLTYVVMVAIILS